MEREPRVLRGARTDLQLARATLRALEHRDTAGRRLRGRMSSARVGDRPSYAVDTAGRETVNDQFEHLLQELNRCVVASGSILEGNLFYHHRAPIAEGHPPDPSRAHKRRNVHRAVGGRRTLLEVGFNAGHSALLALASNPDLTYVGVDLGAHPYVKPCGDVLRRAFGKRFRLFVGDSRTVLPLMAHTNRYQSDLIHVDGGHSAEVCMADLLNAARLLATGGSILLDDTDHPLIRGTLGHLCEVGILTQPEPGPDWEGEENLLAEVV